MGIAYHTVYSTDGTLLNVADRAYIGTVTVTVPSTTTTGVGTVAVTWTEPIPTPYTVLVSPVENMTWWATAKTTLGFTLNVYSTAGAGLAGGVVEVLIIS